MKNKLIVHFNRLKPVVQGTRFEEPNLFDPSHSELAPPHDSPPEDPERPYQIVEDDGQQELVLEQQPPAILRYPDRAHRPPDLRYSARARRPPRFLFSDDMTNPGCIRLGGGAV